MSTLAGLLLLSGCATKKYVREQIAAVDTRVVSVSNQARENAERIDAVDVRAQQGITDAAAARQAAAAADTRAGQAQTSAQTAQTAATGAQTSATTANSGVTAANTRITTVETRINNLNIDHYTAGAVQTVTFKVGSADLDDAAKGTLDGVASQVASLNAGFLIEIQGFASSEGQEASNVALSQKRAEAVQRYLVGKNIPLFRIMDAGLCIEKPVGDNQTRAGREQNRRVELRVMRLQ
jgi:outer membrane protein OmpA-like peptidoglycan-associated protein